MRKLIWWLVVLVLAAAPVLAACSSGGAASEVEEGYQVGDLAPGFGLRSLSGETVFLNQFRGRPVLLNFWASWCPPCRAEMPILQQVFEDKALSDRGLVMLGIDLGEDLATVDSFMKSNGLSFPVLLDTQQLVAQQYNIRSIPTTFFIDKDGIIKDVRIGAFASKSQLILGLNKILP